MIEGSGSGVGSGSATLPKTTVITVVSKELERHILCSEERSIHVGGK
jgi:hypothetical protein